MKLKGLKLTTAVICDLLVVTWPGKTMRFQVETAQLPLRWFNRPTHG